MKAKFIAAALALSILNLPAHASIIPPNASVKQAEVAQSKIDLNKADLSSLTGSFKGIGKKRAQSIIAYRESHQGFKSLEELAEVKGLGQHFMMANRDKLKEVFTIN